MAQLVLVLALHVLNATATIELTTKHVVRLNEALKLTSQVSVLTLEALGVLLEGIALSEKISIVRAVL